MRLHGNILRTLQSVIKCKIQQVLDKETISKEMKQETSVNQKDKLSHLLYNLFHCC